MKWKKSKICVWATFLCSNITTYTLFDILNEFFFHFISFFVAPSHLFLHAGITSDARLNVARLWANWRYFHIASAYGVRSVYATGSIYAHLMWQTNSKTSIFFLHSDSVFVWALSLCCLSAQRHKMKIIVFNLKDIFCVCATTIAVIACVVILPLTRAKRKKKKKNYWK